MNRQPRNSMILLLFFFSVCFSYAHSQEKKGIVEVRGALSNVMRKGDLKAAISLDTLQPLFLFGLGPLDSLRGELLTLNGITYVARATMGGGMTVQKTQDAKAPFFVFSYVPKWKEIALPDSVTDLGRLERYLSSRTGATGAPIVFRLKGSLENSMIHVVNLPRGVKIRSPQDAHNGQKKYKLRKREVEMLGFFSTMHQGIFTHHDSFIHLHLLSSDKKMSGHVDEASFKKGQIKLYVPEQLEIQ